MPYKGGKGNGGGKDSKWPYPLHLAAQNGHKEVVEKLLNKGANVNTKTQSQKLTPLYLAVQNNRLSVVKVLLKHKDINVNEKYQKRIYIQLCPYIKYGRIVEPTTEKLVQGWSLLHLAVENGHIEMVKELLLKGANFNDENEDGCTPLLLAARKDHRSIVELLIKNGADVSGTQDDNNLLKLAAERNQWDMVKLLIDIGSKAKSRNYSTNNGFTLLHFAALDGLSDAVEFIINNKTNVNIETSKKFIPLHFAAMNGHLDMVQLLIKHKSNFNAKTECGYTPLFFAVREGHLATVQLLIEEGANVNDENPYLHLAASKGHKEVVEFLIKKGKAQVDATEKDNFTPLHLAAKNGHKEVVKVLLNNGSNVFAQDHSGKTAWHLAATHWNHIVLKQLWEWGTKDNNGKPILTNEELKDKWLLGRDHSGKISWHLAAEKGHTEVLQKLWDLAKELNKEVEKKGKPELKINLKNDLLLAKDNDRKTAWHLAAEKGSTEVLKQLWERGKKELTTEELKNNWLDAKVQTALDALQSNEWLTERQKEATKKLIEGYLEEIEKIEVEQQNETLEAISRLFSEINEGKQETLAKTTSEPNISLLKQAMCSMQPTDQLADAGIHMGNSDPTNHTVVQSVLVHGNQYKMCVNV